MFRIGQGYDIHQLVPGRPLILGGCQLQHPQNLGLLGHSDADALIHAIIDALLGALALGDIGQHFPDNDPKWAGADSASLLRRTLELPQFQGWQLANLDANIIAQSPKIAPYIPAIRGRLAQLLHCQLEQVSVKAKTNEKLDSVGQNQAIATTAVVLLQKNPEPDK